MIAVGLQQWFELFVGHLIVVVVVECSREHLPLMPLTDTSFEASSAAFAFPL